MPSAPITQDVNLGAFAINTTAAVVYYAATPTRIHRFVYVSTTANTSASAIITFGVQQADATATTPTGASLGTMTITTALAAVNLVTAFDFQATYGDLIIYPGERIVATSNGGGDSGTGQAIITVEPLGWADADVRSHVSGHPGSTDIVTALANVTTVTS